MTIAEKMDLHWRLISFAPGDGPYNMAVDEAILEAFLAGEVPPTLRLYRFEPATFSFGYAQRTNADTISNLVEKGFDVVRRPTGGRCVLHEGEITYSFVAGIKQSEPDNNQGQILEADVSAAYKQICRALIASMDRFDVAVEIGSARSTYKHNEDCFAATTLADLHVAGKKMIGSAQLRRKHAVLQHGSILLKQRQDLFTSVFASKTETFRERHHANLFDVIGKSLSMPELEAALQQGFEQEFSCRFIESDLTPGEIERVKIYLDKYQELRNLSGKKNQTTTVVS